MNTFEEYVDGKTIAIVGPAPAPYDQSAEIEAHDIVYRCSYGLSVPADPAVRWSSSAAVGTDHYRKGAIPAGTGARTDMSFYNVGTMFMAQRGELDHVLEDLDWAVFKLQGMEESALTKTRACHRPPMVIPGTELQVTAMLWDLTFYRPATVSVYGADFYVDDVERWYDPAYQPPEVLQHPTDLDQQVNAILWHDLEDNRRVIRRVRDVGWLQGDQRFLDALDMTYDEHSAIIAKQLARASAQSSLV
jgi:hypothetical protein